LLRFSQHKMRRQLTRTHACIHTHVHNRRNLS
jgi:hypothetical protein